MSVALLPAGKTFSQSSNESMTKTELAKTQKEWEREKKLTILFPYNEVEGIVREDGALWHTPKSYGGVAVVEMKQGQIIQAVTGTYEKSTAEAPEPILLSPPSTDYKLPLSILRTWATVLMQFDTEALVVYGRNRKHHDRWLAVVPEQEVSSTSVDVDDFGPACELLSKRGYERVGTIHTHPGGMTTCSRTDTGELWDGFGGIHLIVARTGGIGCYYSAGGMTWRLGTKEWMYGSAWDKKVQQIKLTKGLNLSKWWIEMEDPKVWIKETITEKTHFIPVGFRGYKRKDKSLKYYNQQMEKNKKNLNRTPWDWETAPELYRGERIKGSTGWAHLEQKDGVRVSVMYGEHWPMRYERGIDGWVAGNSPSYGSGVLYPSDENREGTRKWDESTLLQWDILLWDLLENMPTAGGGIKDSLKKWRKDKGKVATRYPGLVMESILQKEVAEVYSAMNHQLSQMYTLVRRGVSQRKVLHSRANRAVGEIGLHLPILKVAMNGGVYEDEADSLLNTIIPPKGDK